MKRPFIPSARAAKVLGIVAFAVAIFALYDAYDRRGGRAPWPIRLLSPM